MKNIEMTYREAKQEDLNSLVDLGYKLSLHEKSIEPLLVIDDDAKGKSHEKYKSEITNELANDQVQFYVAKKNEGDIVGYIYGYISETPLHISTYDKMGTVEACYVEKDYRGREVAKNLTQLLQGWLADKSISLIELGVYSENAVSVDAWRKFGFRDYHIQMRKINEL